MAKKSKRGKKGKKSKLEKKLWCTEDLDFDENGNLCVTNTALSKALSKAIYRTDRRFRIRVHCRKNPMDSDQPGVADTKDSSSRKKGDTTPTISAEEDPGRPPMDAMCPC